MEEVGHNIYPSVGRSDGLERGDKSLRYGLWMVTIRASEKFIKYLQYIRDLLLRRLDTSFFRYNGSDSRPLRSTCCF